MSSCRSPIPLQSHISLCSSAVLLQFFSTSHIFLSHFSVRLLFASPLPFPFPLHLESQHLHLKLDIAVYFHRKSVPNKWTDWEGKLKLIERQIEAMIMMEWYNDIDNVDSDTELGSLVGVCLSSADRLCWLHDWQCSAHPSLSRFASIKLFCFQFSAFNHSFIQHSICHVITSFVSKLHFFQTYSSIHSILSTAIYSTLTSFLLLFII